ncbi:MAG: glycosyltransferase family 4 protein, partial [Chitinophagaceae bacterium]|nr:glycosyltransferase family 4 protein [Chitinophagaceae bacterium]
MNNVLYIGPGYKNHRGGIGAVLEVYAAHIRPFKFIPTYSNKSFIRSFLTYIWSFWLLFYKLITDRAIKIVHIHTSSKGSFIRKSFLLIIAKLFGKKTIIHVHASEFHLFYEKAGILRPYIRYIISKSDVVVCLSEKWRQYFADNFKVKSLAIINNVIEKKSGIEGPELAGKVINLLFLGLIGNRKGIFDLIDVLAKYKDEYGNRYRLNIGGNGEIDRLEKSISDNGLNATVSYVGWVNGEKKAKLLKDCDIFILPSYNEGLPISILEALVCAKPVISTYVGGIPEVVKPGYNLS